MQIIRVVHVIICLFFFNVILGQNEEKTADLEYGIKEKGRLYFKNIIYRGGGTQKTFLKSINLNKDEEFPKLTSIFNPSTKWKIDGDEVNRIDVIRYKNSFQVAKMHIKELETLDSLKRAIERKKLSSEFLDKYGHLKGKERVSKALEFSFKNNSLETNKTIPIVKALNLQNRIEKKGLQEGNDIAIDFLPGRENGIKTFRFFLRVKEFFTIWECEYPNDKTDSTYNVGKWKEIVTYNSKEYLPIFSEKRYLPSGKKELTKSKAIKDDNFFIGDFKIIKLGKNVFVINTDHGAIYHIGREKIVKVGQVNMKKYQKRINNKNIFIEDKDEGQVIFFAPVKRIHSKEKAPFLKTKVILNDRDFQKMFKNL